MAISFSGLVTGLDTTALIDAMMAADRAPIERLTADKAYQNGRLAAYTQLNTSLSTLLGKVGNLDTVSELNSKAATLTGEQNITAIPSETATTGTYQLKAFDFAQVEKSVSQGFSDKDALTFGTGNITITVGTTTPENFTFAIDDSTNSLEGIASAINASGSGVTAAIINDGTEAPFRLVLTGASAGKPEEVGFSVDFSGMIGGSYALPTLTETQSAQQSHIQIDGIDIYSNNNTFSDAIPGVSLTLDKVDAGTTTASLAIVEDSSNLKSKLNEFISAYNETVSFITNQSSRDGSNAGILIGDSGMNNIKRRLQNFLSTPIGVSGAYQSLSQIGLETQKDGTILLNSEHFSAAMTNDSAGVAALLAGETGVDGVATGFKNYLTDMTNTSKGFLAGQSESINRNINRMDDRIVQIQRRLDQRETTLLEQFTAMEQMVSSLNAQSDYLTQQMDMLNNLWSQKK